MVTGDRGGDGSDGRNGTLAEGPTTGGLWRPLPPALRTLLHLIGVWGSICVFVSLGRRFHYIQHHTTSEDWSMVLTVPLGLIFGIPISTRSISWTNWLARHFPVVRARVWLWPCVVLSLYVGALSLVALIALWLWTVDPSYGLTFPVMGGLWLMITLSCKPPKNCPSVGPAYPVND